jgi:hypothetical protein
MTENRLDISLLYVVKISVSIRGLHFESSCSTYCDCVILDTAYHGWPRGLRLELSSLARTLGLWIPIQIKGRMSVLCAVILCVGRGLATGWSPVKGVPTTVYRNKKMKKRPRPNEGLHSHNNKSSLYYCRAESTATMPITDTAQCRYR